MHLYLSVTRKLGKAPGDVRNVLRAHDLQTGKGGANDVGSPLSVSVRVPLRRGPPPLRAPEGS